MSPPIGLSPMIYEPDTAYYPPPNYYANCWQWLTPTNVQVSGSTIINWWDASAGIGVIPGPNPVTSFSGSPSPQTGGSINGVPAISYVTGDQALNSGTVPATFYKCTIFAVINASGSRTQYEGVYDNGFTNSFYLGTDSTGVYWLFDMLNTTGPLYGNFINSTRIGGSQILCATYNGSTNIATLSVNGTNTTTSTVFNGFSPPVLLSNQPVAYGGRISGGSFYCCPGVYGDGIIYTDVKTGSDFVNIHRYLGAKYGIPVP